MRKIVDYSGDLALHVKSKTTEMLIKDAIYGMFDCLINKNYISHSKKILNYTINGNLDEAIIDALNFFLKTFYIKKTVPYRIYIKKIDNNNYSMKVFLGKFNGTLKNYIKAATYYENKIHKENDFLTLKVIFDV